MDDTILPEGQVDYRSLPLRITYKALDYQVYLLKKDITRDTRELRILFDGMVHTLANDGTGWHFRGEDGNQDLANAIWGAVSLRYRL